MLRVTGAKALNDPFELKPSSELIDFVINRRNPSSDVINLLNNERNYVEYTLSWNKGVISLSQTKDNLLMWSHYSDEHRGGVIEFTFDIEHHPHSRTPVQRGLFKSLADNNYQYGAVKYRKKRTIDSSLLVGEGYELINHVIDNLAFVKSNDWIYEDEQRFIVNSQYCDITLIEDTTDNRGKLEKLNIPLNMIGDKLAIPPEHEIQAPKDSFMLSLTPFSNRSDYMQFAKVKEQSVTGIYLGAKMPKANLDEILTLKNDLSKFTNLNGNLYQAIIHPDMYDLEFKQL
jgi:hypothetical protein